MPRKIIWNDDLDNALRELIAEGANRELCSEVMGISWPTLRKRLRELGVPVTPSRSTQPRTLRALELVDAGQTMTDAARIAGVSRGTIRLALKRREAARL